ncbi:MAG: type II toxin-antitoxin system RelE/ParE family toxin [Bacteroidia bacterium]
MKTYRISAEAINDLDTIWLYTKETWSVKQADRYYSLIMAEIEYIVQNTESGKSIDGLKEGYRVSKVKSHLIFYKKQNEQVIDVIRILHQRMDIENRLNQ